MTAARSPGHHRNELGLFPLEIVLGHADHRIVSARFKLFRDAREHGRIDVVDQGRDQHRNLIGIGPGQRPGKLVGHVAHVSYDAFHVLPGSERDNRVAPHDTGNRHLRDAGCACDVFQGCASRHSVSIAYIIVNGQKFIT